jgi:hypothetical protein
MAAALVPDALWSLGHYFRLARHSGESAPLLPFCREPFPFLRAQGCYAQNRQPSIHLVGFGNTRYVPVVTFFLCPGSASALMRLRTTAATPMHSSAATDSTISMIAVLHRSWIQPDVTVM